MRIVARAFVKNLDGKFLMTKHRGKNIWVLPGGGVEGKESIFKCIKRELREEFNIKINIIGDSVELKSEKIIKSYVNPICSYKIEFENRNKILKKRLEHIFLVEIISDTNDIEIQEEEIGEYKFFSLDEIINLEDTYDQIKELALYLKESDK